MEVSFRSKFNKDIEDIAEKSVLIIVNLPLPVSSLPLNHPSRIFR
jgi:hypothetical protein